MMKIHSTKWLAAAICLLALALPANADGHPEKQPGPKSTGKIYTWTAGNGTKYEYYVPKDYDADAGANLTLILHGSNLDRRWGFANHKAGKFRKDDIVVSPDGTTPNGNRGFNSMQSDGELKRMHEFHEELRETWNIKATFLYGHSQGSFFSFYYAGAYPDDVQGVVGQASGVWIGTQATKKHHHQAICLMHGTKDPVVGYGQSIGGYDFYEEAKYPLLHLRSLENWNHWPAQYQTEMQLAWCEGMTTEDPERLAICFETIADFKKGVDPSVLYAVAERASTFEGVPSKVVSAASKAMKEVEKIATKHVTSITKALGKNKGDKLADKSWVGHVPRFLRQYQGVPSWVEFEKKWSKKLDKNTENASKHSKAYWRLLKQKKEADAFEAGVDMVKTGFFAYWTEDVKRLDQLEKWHKDAKDLKLKRAQLKDFDATVPVFRSALEKGVKEFEKQSGSRFR
jgi:predicted esterase